VEAIPKFVRTCTIVYAESAVTHRRSIVRGFMTVEQTENMHVVMSPDAETLPGRPNKHFQGTTSGNAIMGVGHPEEREWTMTVGQKKTLFGPDARTTDIDDEPRRPGRGEKPRDDTDVEPVHFWAMTPLLYHEIVHRLQAKAVIDLTATDTFATVCVELGVPYLGICHTSSHVEALKRRLATVVFDKFTVEGNPLYKSQLAQTIHKATHPDGETGDDNQPAPKATAKAKSKAKAKAKSKAKAMPKALAAAAAAGGNSDDADLDPEEEEPEEEDDLDASGEDL
jgi:hypothetical protein